MTSIAPTPMIGDEVDDFDKRGGGVREGGGDNDGKNKDGVLLGLLPLLDGPCLDFLRVLKNVVSLNVRLCDIGARRALNRNTSKRRTCTCIVMYMYLHVQFCCLVIIIAG